MKTIPHLIEVQVNDVPELSEAERKYHQPFTPGKYDIWINLPVDAPEGHIWGLRQFHSDGYDQEGTRIVLYGRSPVGLVRHAFRHIANTNGKGAERWDIGQHQCHLDHYVYFVNTGEMHWIRYAIVPVMPPKPIEIID